MAWNKWNKAPTKKSPKKSWSPEELKMVGFVMKKGIKIAIIPNWEGSNDEWRVELNIKKKIHLDPAIYMADEAHIKMYEYYKYYYDKYRN